MDALDEYYATTSWKHTTDRKYVSALDKASNMQKSTFAIIGEKVCVTHNTYYRRQLIPNGAIGVVRSINHASESVVVDIIKPKRIDSVLFKREFSPTITTAQNVQLRRSQLPLELAVAQTIHGGQGDTEGAIATCLTSTWKNQMWLREMLFTLLTRVGNLSDIHFVEYECALAPVLAPYSYVLLCQILLP